MATKVYGPTPYELLEGGLTDAQADALVAEYAKLGLRYKKCTTRGICLITKAPAAEYELFLTRLRQEGKAINATTVRDRGSTGSRSWARPAKT